MAHIQISNLTLDYIVSSHNKSLKKNILQSFKSLLNRQTKSNKAPFFRAVDNLNLSINNGDRIGLLGKNGAGKSTLLSILSGIYHPTQGSIHVEGHISSLLNISVGLNPDATGYENIVIIGILLGKTPKLMKEKFTEIEEFTELGEFLKASVRTYSDGMRMRLVFAIVTSIESDILLLDEVVGIGDNTFIEKAQNRLHNLIDKSSILVIASHSNDIIRKFCNKVLYLDRGKCKYFGDVEEGISRYTTDGD